MSDISSDAVTGKGISVTIKYGKGYEDTWLNFRGLAGEVKEQIAEAFGLDRASVDGLSLAEVVLNATRAAHALNTARERLGAVSIPSGGGSAPAETKSESPFHEESQNATGSANSAWAAARQEENAPPANPNQDILDEIKRCESVEELTGLWASNQARFADAEVMAAYKAHGKALKAKAAA